MESSGQEEEGSSKELRATWCRSLNEEFEPHLGQTGKADAGQKPMENWDRQWPMLHSGLRAWVSVTLYACHMLCLPAVIALLNLNMFTLLHVRSKNHLQLILLPCSAHWVNFSLCPCCSLHVEMLDLANCCCSFCLFMLFALRLLQFWVIGIKRISCFLNHLVYYLSRILIRLR